MSHHDFQPIPIFSSKWYGKGMAKVKIGRWSKPGRLMGGLPANAPGVKFQIAAFTFSLFISFFLAQFHHAFFSLSFFFMLLLFLPSLSSRLLSTFTNKPSITQQIWTYSKFPCLPLFWPKFDFFPYSVTFSAPLV